MISVHLDLSPNVSMNFDNPPRRLRAANSISVWSTIMPPVQIVLHSIVMTKGFLAKILPLPPIRWVHGEIFS